MKQITISMLATLMLCGSVQAMNKTLYQLPVVGQLTPLKAVGCIAVGALAYKVMKAGWQNYVHAMFEDVVAHGSLKDIQQMTTRYPALLDAQFRNGRGIYFLAVQHNRADMVTWLLENNITSIIQGPDTTRPVEFAKERGHTAIVAVFEADAKRKEKERSQIFFGHAAYSGNKGAVAESIKTGVDVNLPDQDGDTPLMLAIKGAWGCPNFDGTDHAAVVALLLDAGADTTLVDKYGKTAEELAIELFNWPTKGYSAGPERLKPIVQTVFVQHRERLAKRAELQAHLHIYVQNGHEAFVREAIAAGCDIHSGGNLGCTPLHYAITFKQKAMVKFLLDNGARIDITDPKGCTTEEVALETYNDAPGQISSDILKLIRQHRDKLAKQTSEQQNSTGQS